MKLSSMRELLMAAFVAASSFVGLGIAAAAERSDEVMNQICSQLADTRIPPQLPTNSGTATPAAGQHEATRR